MDGNLMTLYLKMRLLLKKMIEHIETIVNNFNYYQNPHIKWEYLKCEIRKFSISFAKMKNKIF